jgi:8-oxo-dGTP pyrophosphatase MutT (NUDIX family)
VSPEFVLPLLQSHLVAIGSGPTRPTFSDFDLSGTRPSAPILKPAAVLVPLVARATGLNVILTKRASHLPTHAGQIAFPGGRCEDSDADVGATALREAHEEIGLDPSFVTLIGASDAYETVTRFAVTPVVGLVDPLAVFTPDPSEVDAVFEVPLAFLMDPANHVPQERIYDGIVRRFYAMAYGDYYVWGATAGMLRALYARVFEGRPPA